MCFIHKKYGDHCLAAICRSFPRTYRQINGVREAVLRNSCPEVARYLLTARKIAIVALPAAEDIPDSRTEEKAFPYDVITIEQRFIEVLQTEELMIEQRLITLLYKSGRLEKVLAGKEYDRLPGILSSEEGSGFIPAGVGHLIQIRVLEEVVKWLLGKLDILCQDFLRQAVIGLHALQNNNNLGRCRPADLLCQPYRIHIENYLVSDLYNGFYHRRQDRYVPMILGLIVKYAMIRTILWGMELHSGRVDSVETGRLFFSLCRVTAHGYGFAVPLGAVLEKYRLFELTHVAAFLGLLEPVRK